MEKALVIYNTNALAWDILIAMLVLGFYLTFPSRFQIASDGWASLRPRGRGRMLRRARRNFVRTMIIDDLVSNVEEKVFSGIITRKEASEIYRDARKYWPVKELFPSPELLKENINKRLASKTHTPVPLPDVRKEKKSGWVSRFKRTA